MNLPRVTSIINPPSGFESIPPDVLAAAGQRGTAVHEACAAYAVGLWSPVPNDLQGYFASFRLWFDSYVVEVIAVEVELVHPAFRYVGHADLIARITGVTTRPVVTVIDYKTPIVATRKWNMQCAGYVEAARKQYGAEVGGALQLRKDGGLPKMTWVEDQAQAFAAFLGMLSGWNYSQGGGK
jgi:hypothetical protein